MTSADKIASHGRTGRVSALTIASFGRLAKAVAIKIIVEVMRLISEISQRLELTSRIK
jgi:hypothetical protein